MTAAATPNQALQRTAPDVVSQKKTPKPESTFNHRYMRKIRIQHVIIAFALSSFGSPAHAALVIDFTQVGNDVVATGSGTVNLAGLSLFDSFSGAQINLDASSGNFRGGTTGVQWSRYRFLSGPSGFGPGTGDSNFPSSSSGDYFGLTAFNNMLLVPGGYVSGTPLANTTTWNNRTIANLGLAPEGSTFTYTWGSGANADSLTINITTVPEPSSALLVATGVVFLFRRHRRVRN